MPRRKKETESAPELDNVLQLAYARQAEELHNAIVEMLVARKADVYTILFVLEILRYELITQKYTELMG